MGPGVFMTITRVLSSPNLWIRNPQRTSNTHMNVFFIIVYIFLVSFLATREIWRWYLCFFLEGCTVNITFWGWGGAGGSGVPSRCNQSIPAMHRPTPPTPRRAVVCVCVCWIIWHHACYGQIKRVSLLPLFFASKLVDDERCLCRL